MRLINFGITGNEFQDNFNTDKYVALACQQPKGRELQELVELRWEEWCRIVAKAPWRSYWRKSVYGNQQCVTPADNICLEQGCGNIPLAVLGCAVWGFGFEGWLKKQGREARTPITEILKLQGVKNSCVVRNRTHMFDEKLYKGCGLQLPAEFGDLDRWLEPMWQQVCSSTSSK